MEWLVAILISAGAFLVCTASFPGIYPPARKALRSRAPKALTQSQVLQNQLAEKIAPRLELDPIKQSQTAALLRNLGHAENPELFHAQALAGSLFAAALCAILLLFSVPFGLVGMGLAGISFYRKRQKMLEKELAAKRAAIERELPQFASTIRQSLGTTRDVVAILSSYRRVCGPALAGEIDKTINDMTTGNAERAIRALESRVASPKLGQLTRGLLAVLRGDDQRMYFDVLAEEYRKSQNEEVERELLRRPQKLYPYMGAMFVGFALMLVVSLGTEILSGIHQYFG
ncbi:hypothetical protein [Oscillibacter ruminantium]|uniref:hypothetical protein n=1 Tax=Oscillibacter ruminantium TaxID=1263547 RepID=UPI00332F5EC3